MNIVSRALLTVSLAAGALALAGAPAHADDHWIACPGTNTLTACVAADTGDVSFQAATVTYSDCGHLTSPDGCEVPISATVPVLTPVVDAPDAEYYLQCGDAECQVPNPGPINPGIINPIALNDNKLPLVENFVEISIQ
jgi:hypothetical protein